MTVTSSSMPSPIAPGRSAKPLRTTPMTIESLRPSISRSRCNTSSSRSWWTEFHDRWRCRSSFTSPQLLVSLPPELDDTQTRKLITGCDLPHKISDPASAGQQIEIIFRVSQDGHMGTVGSSDRKIPVLSLFRAFQSCRFGIYSPNGKPTQYHAHLSVKAQ